MNDIINLIYKAIVTGETFYENGFNDTYLTREMFQQFLELHKITDKEFEDAIDELTEKEAIYLEDDIYYRTVK